MNTPEPLPRSFRLVEEQRHWPEQHSEAGLRGHRQILGPFTGPFQGMPPRRSNSFRCWQHWPASTNCG